MVSVQVERLYKVFGPQPSDVVRKLENGADEDAVRAAGATAAVVDASFTVTEGETFVVMGLSGSGKSTLIRMLNGLLTPTSGKVYVDDADITGLSAKALREMRQRKMSMVFQHFALFPHRSVLDNTAYGLRIQGVGAAETQTRAREALDMVGLEGWEDRYPQQLSGGMRQRVGLARALAARTDVLLMDEAFSALDPLIKREMQDQLVNLQAKLGKTIIFITHDLNEAMRLGDRIAVMRAGRIVQIGTSEQIINDPADDYVTRFVQDVDRSRVLTAASIARAQFPAIRGDMPLDDALALFHQHPVERLFVSDAQQRLIGALSVDSVERARLNGHRTVDAALGPVSDAIPGAAPMHSLFRRLSGRSGGLAVVDQDQRLLGVVNAESLLAALSHRASTEEANSPHE